MSKMDIKPQAGAVVDPTEVSLGILCYLRPSKGFLAVSKARYSDFLVHEVGASGEIARLTDLSGSVPTDSADSKEAAVQDAAADRAGTKRKREEDSATENSSIALGVTEKARTELVGLLKRTYADVDNDNTDEEKAGMAYVGVADRILDFGQSETGNQDQKFLGIPMCLSATKEHRKEWHTWIRSSPLLKKVLSDTHKEDEKYLIRLWHKDFEKDMPNFRAFGRKGRGGDRQQNKPSKDTPYLQFVLYKENMDTGSALNQIQRRCSPGGRGGRGRGGRGRGGRCGPNDRLRMGHAGMKDKRGVTCQFVTVPSSTPISTLASFNRSQGGGGHTQSAGSAELRVGNFRYVKEELRLGRLQGNRFDVVLRNIQQESDAMSREDLKTTVANTANDLLSSGFINYFGTQRFGKFHDTHLTGIAALQGNFQKAVETVLLPKPEGTEQPSFREARVAWQQRFDGLGSDGNESARAEAEQSAAEILSKECGRFMNSEKSLCQSLSREPLNYKKAYSTITKTMRMMFVHAFQSLVWNHLASHRIGQFNLEKGNPGLIPGDLVLLNSSEENAKEGQLNEVHTVTEDDVAEGKFCLEDVVLPLIGAKTSLPSYAAELVETLLREHGLTLKDIQDYSERDFACPGDYRKLLCRPTDVDFELLEYSDPREPLVQTDLMKLSSIQIREASANSKESLLGMRIGFTLPSSAYATIALRELMKRPTSSEFQGELKLGAEADDEEKN